MLETVVNHLKQTKKQNKTKQKTKQKQKPVRLGRKEVGYP